MAARRFALPFSILFALLLSEFAAADSSLQAPLAVWAIGLPNGYVIMEHQTAAVQVTADDVARGVLDVQDGTRIAITTTEPSVVTLDFRIPGRLFRAVQVDGAGRSVQFGPPGGRIDETQAATGRRIVTVNYRFTLAPETTPGTYSWPLAMGVRTTAIDLARLARAHGNVTGDTRETASDHRDAILIGRIEP